jgi:alkyl hydroperoxide reductase subunit F
LGVKELIIVGAGPAGITAAVYAARKKMDLMVISRDIGGQAAWSSDIENYTGYQFISGPDLAAKFRDHLSKFDFDLLEGETVTKVEKTAEGFAVKTQSGKEFISKTVIVASGKRPRLLNVPGEGKFIHKGVTYCATCDGPLFTGKDVAVIGGGNSALDAVLQMTKLAKKVYLINVGDKLTGDPVMIDKVVGDTKVEILHNTKTLEFSGDKFLSGMKVETSGKARDIAVQGVFVEVGLIPNSILTDLAEKNELQEIKVNIAAETSVPGLFAAGDVTNGQEKQIIIAAGEGAKAALSAFKYLSTHK